MKKLVPAVVLLLLIFSGCSRQPSDEEALEKLVRDYLEWSSDKSFLGFKPVYDPTGTVSAMDLQALDDAVRTISKTDLFDDEFLENLRELVTGYDSGIKSGRVSWQRDEMPPYAGADPWCFCQDIPLPDPSEYWLQVFVEIVWIENDTAMMNWFWHPEEDPYPVYAKKQNKTWKISYLYGFDPEL